MWRERSRFVGGDFTMMVATKSVLNVAAFALIISLLERTTVGFETTSLRTVDFTRHNRQKFHRFPHSLNELKRNRLWKNELCKNGLYPSLLSDYFPRKLSLIRPILDATMLRCNSTSCLRTAFRILSSLVLALSLVLSFPVQSSSASQAQYTPASSTSYSLQSNMKRNNPSRQTIMGKRTISNRYDKSRTDTRAVKWISMVIIAMTITASSFRASLRTSKRKVRNVTPFGIIRNQSALGNGVSVLRVCMAFKFDDNEIRMKEDDVQSLLRRLKLEENELYLTKAFISTLPQQSHESLRQRALVDYLSNVASVFLEYSKYMTYGSLQSMRVPFVEEAVLDFREIAKEEHVMYDRQQILHRPRQSTTKLSSQYIVATILLVIKGDHTSVSLPFGIVRQRDMSRALTRIVNDVRVDDCLIGSELLVLPDLRTVSMEKRGEKATTTTITEKEVLKVFPNLVPLT